MTAPSTFESLIAPLAYPLGGYVPVPPITTLCFEEQQFVSSPPTLSALEAQILTPQVGNPYTELFRSTFVNNCTASNWNVSIARTVLFFANSTTLGTILNDLYPGLNPDTGVLCLRRRTTYVDAALSSLYPVFQFMVGELAARGIPQPHQNLLNQYMQPESCIYRVCDVADCITLASILTLRGS